MNFPKKTILLVEDDFEIRSLFKDVLELEGFQVLESSNGQEALVLLQNSRPHLMFVDLMMPIMNGWDFIKEIKQQEHLSQIPVVVVSAFVEKPGSIQCDGFLEKPIDLNLFLAMAHQFSESKVHD